ncbi:hypothetical protein PFHG_02273 [Plasmodium falciparum HB3]|uniref:Erythrocyte membrane protein 1 n=1 Tax=Plasmodium falciparum (isolate HB3) TaxID=137071 RepID=A0A0L7KBM9_PLAFX|nr:hypothetical protein PFHG_02273 [Plasmodium falciparum HB3]
MVRPSRAPRYDQATSAKEFLDLIGQTVHKNVHGAALEPSKGKLEGHLSLAKFEKNESDPETPNDPCHLDHRYHTNVTIGGDKEYPCEKRSDVRFSYTEGAECDKSKIRGSNGKSEGACAPFRRLHLCDQHLEKINRYDKVNNNTLLAEVCLAAKFEAESLEKYRAQYQLTNPGFHTNICTELARSFADIGDIIRGKDLYLGNKKEKENLEKNLRQIFKKIYDNLNDADVQKHYKDDDKGTENYYKLRNAWWEANREKVWKAITCDAVGGIYFRKTCGTGTWTNEKCQCLIGDVPTYFDYVPQFLRWFEEWAEDFCRKKKKYVEIVKTNCRGKDKDGKDLYCSGNGLDCQETIRAIGKFVLGQHCTKCSFLCGRYKKWINNQKQEFLKQKKKCENEISGNSRHKRSAIIKDYKAYDKEFYEILKSNNVGGLDKFLELLKEQSECKHFSTDEGIIDFSSTDNNSSNKTFYHSEYCEECPQCGVEKKSNGEFQEKPKKKSGKCDGKKLYNIPNNANFNEINVLSFGDEHKEIIKKIEQFCAESNSDSSELTEKWKCYYGDQQYEACTLENKTNKSDDDPEEIQKTFHDFFYFWIGHLLNDSIEWRDKINNCIEKAKKGKCKSGCNKDCECFKNWIDRKKGEWEEIKRHFKTQEGFEVFNYDYDLVLEHVLNLDELFKDITEAYGNSQEIQGIKDTLEKKKNQAPDDATEQKNTIDLLFEYDSEEAEKCKKTQDECNQQKKQKEQPKDISRALDPPADRRPGPIDQDEDHGSDSEPDSDGEDDEDKDTLDAVVENTEVGPSGPATPVDDKVCDIVSKLFSGNDFGDGCGTKYDKYGREKFPNWKCISGDKIATDSEAKGRQRREASGAVTTTGKDGAICVPPRRRRLYVTPLTTWASGNTAASVSQGDGVSTETSQTSLLHAFVKSAAVETFFLWDRYKKEKKKEKQAAQENVYNLKDDNDEAQTKLKNGNIPPDFLRQMFYTLGDYRDICVGNTNIVEPAISPSEKEKMQKIQQKIKEILNGENEQQRGKQNSVKTPQQTWWEKNAQHIWKGMVCALTYKETSGSDGSGKIEQNSDLKEAFFGKDDKPGTQNGTFKDKYDYEKVKLDDQSETEAKSNDPTRLSEFVKRPTYFRWLEEWGEEFCRKQKHKLYIIEKECKVEANSGTRRKNGTKTPKCSCYGEDCETILSKNSYDTVADLECPRCATSCRWYKKWIERKKDEYDEQEKIYNQQKNNYVNGNNKGGGDNGFCGILETTSTTAAAFLQNLGSCKKDNGNEIGEGKKIFEDIDKTFGPATNCKPCSEFKINCKKAKCSGANGNNCNGGKISPNDIKDDNYPNGNIEMLVSDNSKSGFENGLEACKDKGIFKSIKENKWKCVNVCGYVVCKLETDNEEKVSGEKNDGKHIITIRALVTHWVHNFLEDYNKIKYKISHCIKNSDGSTCQNKCNDKCNCVKKWVEEKEKEWGEIKKHYQKQYGDNDSGESYPVRSILEEFKERPEFKNAIKPCPSLDEFEKSKECTETENTKNDKKSDIIDCMLKKLETKATSCQEQHSGKPGQTCENPITPPDDDLLLEEEQNPKNMRPGFCPQNDTTEQQEEEENICTPAETVKKEEEEKEEQEEEEPSGGPPADSPPAGPAPEPQSETKAKSADPPAPAPAAPPSPPLPPLKTALVTSTLAWSVGIGFAAFTYFFLKKKTKSSVGNLFQILQIPKSDYDIPTLKSKNRYIPYKSAQYKGKTYIYMEGDSDEDKYAFMSDTTDVTSSESEYEEMDINDIYVPGSPKYKTLIEVVLEPSGNNTTASGNNTPSDTQNDIQNDGIPSSKITDNEWNTLKHDFISNMLQNTQNTEPNILRDNVDNNTHPTTSRHNVEEKPFIMSIHDRNLYSGEEYNYDMSTNSMDDPKYVSNNVYSGIDLINDSLNSGNQPIDIYDEVLKRKENELFGTNHPKKHTTGTHNVTKPARDDPIHNQLNLFHTWLDRHRDMCEQWNNKEELLDKLKEEWNKDNNNSGNINPSDNTPPTSDIPSGKLSDIPSDNNIPSSNQILNTDVSIQIDMNNPKTTNEFTYVDSNPNQVDDTYVDSNPDNSSMDTILEDLDKPFNEPYYYDMYDDDIYYDVHDHDASTVDTNAMDVPSKVQIEMDVNTKLVKEKYPIADVWDI